MNHHHASRSFLALAALGVSGCVLDARHSESEGSFNRTLTVNGPVELDVQTGSGSIQVRTGGPGTVVVRGRVWSHWGCWSGASPEEQIREVEAKPPVEQSGNEIRLGALRSPWDCVSISFDVTVPPDSRVRARSGSGSQSIAGVHGPVEASAGSGALRIDHTTGDVKASTGSGGIDVETCGGSLIARAGSGSIWASGVEGDIEAHAGSGRVTATQMGRGRTEATTGSGGISVSNVHGPLRLHTGSGSVTVDGEPTGSWNVWTGSGHVDVRVPASAAFDLDALTHSGRIHSDRELAVVGGVTRGRLRGQVRGGGPPVEVSTASGSIRIQ